MDRRKLFCRCNEKSLQQSARLSIGNNEKKKILDNWSCCGWENFFSFRLDWKRKIPFFLKDSTNNWFRCWVGLLENANHLETRGSDGDRKGKLFSSPESKVVIRCRTLKSFITRCVKIVMEIFTKHEEQWGQQFVNLSPWGVSADGLGRRMNWKI